MTHGIPTKILRQQCYPLAARGLRDIALALLLPAAFLTGPPAEAHAFLDHAIPSVGSSVSIPPTSVSLWFTEELEPAFSSVEVTDQSGTRIDAGDAKVDAHHASELHATLKPLRAGAYKVIWHVVSVDTHRTEGHFSFTVLR